MSLYVTGIVYWITKVVKESTGAFLVIIFFSPVEPKSME